MPDRALPQADSAASVDTALLVPLFDPTSDDPVMQSVSDILGAEPYPLPAPAADKYLGWNSAANAVENKDAPTGSGGLDQTAVDARVRAGVKDYAEIGGGTIARADLDADQQLPAPVAGQRLQWNAGATALENVAPTDADEAETLEVRARLPDTGAFSVGDIVNVNGNLYELLASGDASNQISGIVRSRPAIDGQPYLGTEIIEWRADGGTSALAPATIVYINADVVTPAPSKIIMDFYTKSGFVARYLVLTRMTSRDTVRTGNQPPYWAYQQSDENFADPGAPKFGGYAGAQFHADFFSAGANDARGAALTVHSQVTRWELESRSNAVLDAETMYSGVDAIVQAGAGITLTRDAAAHEITVAAQTVGQQLGPPPVVSGVLDDDNLSPDSRQRMEAGYRLTFESASTSVLFALCSYYTGAVVRNNRYPDLDREVIDWANVDRPPIYRRTPGAGEAYSRVLAFPLSATRNVAQRQEGVLIDGLPEINGPNEKWIFMAAVRVPNLDARRPIFSIPLNGTSLDLHVNTNGTLGVSLGTTRTTTDAMTVDTWQKVGLIVSRDISSNYVISFCLDDDAVITESGIGANILPGLSTATRVAIGQDAHAPTVAQTFAGEMADVYGFWHTAAQHPAADLPTWLNAAHTARTAPYGTVVSLAEHSDGDSQYALAPGENLLDAPIALQTSDAQAGRTAVFNEPNLNTEALRGFQCEFVQAPSGGNNVRMRFPFFLPIDYLPRRSSGQMFLEDDTEAVLATTPSIKAYSLTRGWGAAGYAFRGGNAWSFALFVTSGTGQIEALTYWPRVVDNGLHMQLTEIRPVYK